VPLLVLLILVVLIYRRKGPHPATYKMSEPWTRAPILWASEDPVDHGHHGSHPLTVGGGASGKW
jgi:hypothetical protein